MTQVTVQVAHGFDALHTLLDTLPGVAETHDTPEIFYTLAWFENLADCGLAPDVRKHSTCHLVLAQENASGTTICLPMLKGRTLDSLSNYYSSLFGPMQWHPAASPSATHGNVDAQTLWNAIGNHLRRDPAHWPVITLSPLDAQSAFYRHIFAGLRHAGYWVDSYFCFGNWYLQVEQRRFAVYFQSLPSALRNSIARGQRRLTNSGAWDIRVHVATGPELDEAIASFVHVYSDSWKGPEPNTQFIPRLAHMAAAQGWLRLGILTHNGKPIAAQLWFVNGSKASIFKLAYCKGVERFSAGSVLTSAMMEHVLDIDQVAEVDYLTGDDNYKRDWMSHRRERLGIVAFNSTTARGLWAACRHYGGRLLKKAV